MVQAVQAAGSLISCVASYETGKYNRDLSNTMATEAERDGAVTEGRVRDAARQAIGQQVAAQGANGFQQGTGSAIDALTQSQINATLDALTVRRQAAAKARGLRIQGAQAYSAGANALTQGMFGAAAHGVDWANSNKGQSGGGASGSYGGSLYGGNAGSGGAYGVSGSDGIY